MFWSSFCKQTSYRDFKTMSIQPYQLEPEHSSSEQGEEEQIDSGEEEVSSLDYSRLESRWTDLSWCECERYCVVPSEVECVCCKELSFLSQLVEGLLIPIKYIYLISLFVFQRGARNSIKIYDPN